ncbi:MAG: WbqC family protein [Bacteroidota bacterium]
MTAIRPPEYLPRLPYAALLIAADRVVLGDTFRFSRQGHQNRARIRTSQGAMWLSVPRTHAGRPLQIREMPVPDDGWRVRHARGLEAAYRMAPFYDHYAPSLNELWATAPSSMADLTVRSVRWVARQLEAACEIGLASELPGAPVGLADVWASEGAGAFLTLPESVERDRQLEADVRWVELAEVERRQTFPGFEPGLSTLDLLMNYGPESASMLREMTTVHPIRTE